MPFFVVANAACSYRVLQIVSTCIGPYRLAQQTQVLQEGHFTPYDHVFTLCQPMHTEPVEMLTIWLVSRRNRPRDVRFRLRFFSVSSEKTTKTDDFLLRNRKTDQAIFYLRFTTLATAVCCSCIHFRFIRVRTKLSVILLHRKGCFRRTILLFLTAMGNF